MIKLKRPTIIAILLILLVVTGYVNHQLTQRSMSRISNDYQKHEEKEMTKAEENINKNTIETVSDGKDELEIVEGEGIGEISQLTEEINKDIEETLSSENNLKNSNYFVEHRLARDKMRGSLIERLKDIIADEKSSSDTVEKAQNEIMRIGEISENELYLEGLIKAKGFDDALIFLKDDGIKVVVSVDELTEQDVVKILDIVKNETNFDSSKIKIMKKY